MCLSIYCVVSALVKQYYCIGEVVGVKENGTFKRETIQISHVRGNESRSFKDERGKSRWRRSRKNRRGKGRIDDAEAGIREETVEEEDKEQKDTRILKDRNKVEKR